MQSSSSISHPLVRTALRFGMAAGMLSVAWVALLYLIGSNPYGGKSLIAVPFVLLAVLLSQWKIKYYFPNEGPGLGRSFVIGVTTAVLSAAISATGLYGIAHVAGPKVIQRHSAEMQRLLESNKDAYLQERNGLEQYQRTVRSLAITPTPESLASDDLQKKLLFGLLISLPGAVFFRR